MKVCCFSRSPGSVNSLRLPCARNPCADRHAQPDPRPSGAPVDLPSKGEFGEKQVRVLDHDVDDAVRHHDHALGRLAVEAAHDLGQRQRRLLGDVLRRILGELQRCRAACRSSAPPPSPCRRPAARPRPPASPNRPASVVWPSACHSSSARCGVIGPIRRTKISSASRSAQRLASSLALEAADRVGELVEPRHRLVEMERLDVGRHAGDRLVRRAAQLGRGVGERVGLGRVDRRQARPSPRWRCDAGAAGSATRR